MYDKLYKHWKTILGNRIVEIAYEDLVTDVVGTTRLLFDKLKLEFEAECIDFNKNIGTSSTASSVQVREKVHSKSVMRWKQFETQLEPLRSKLEGAGIKL